MKERFTVGDWVVLTKATSKNWCKRMDRYEGLCVQITEYWDNNYIKFNDSNNWTWKFSDKSFRKAKLTELPDYVPPEEDYKYLIPIWKKLKII